MKKKTNPEDREVQNIVRRLITMERDYGESVVRRAASRYVNTRRAQAKLARNIEQAEKDLADLKKKKGM
jgi:hypothetical protein